MKKYTGEYTREISFPLGGIGTGSVGLAGNGRLRDWEIFNRPDKGSMNVYSHLAVRAIDEDGKITAKEAMKLTGLKRSCFYNLVKGGGNQ